MKRIPVIAIILISIILFGCSNEKAIEIVISDFEDAVNDSSESKIQDILSPESDFYITGAFTEFLANFDGFRPVNYSNLSISVNGSDADVDADVSYSEIPEQAKFVMKKEETFLSIFIPDWKVKQYWDTNNPSGNLEYVWMRIKKLLNK